MRFESGIELKLDDGRFRQGDAVTTYKSQGASKTKMIRVEDNRSLLTMANREDLHVAFTRHRANARIFVQDINVLRRVGNRSLIKDLTARDLNGASTAAKSKRPSPEIVFSPSDNKVDRSARGASIGRELNLNEVGSCRLQA